MQFVKCPWCPWCTYFTWFHLVVFGLILFTLTHLFALGCAWLHLGMLVPCYLYWFHGIDISAMVFILVPCYLYWSHEIFSGAIVFLLVNLYSYCCTLLHLVALGCAWLHFLFNGVIYLFLCLCIFIVVMEVILVLWCLYCCHCIF